MLSTLKKIPHLLLFLFTSWIVLLFAFSVPVYAQSGLLENVTDFVNDYTVMATAEHTITFKLPFNAEPIRTTDYIQIYLPAYPGVTAPTSVVGPYGVGPPQFSVSDRYARVTGITLIPGNTLSIYGIIASNPQFESMYQVVVMITEDEAGTIIKNIATTYAQVYHPFNTQVNVTASIDTPQARLIIEGYTAPQSFITFTEAGSVIGTDVSGLNGRFSHIFSGLQPGNHQIAFYGVDSNYLGTSPIITNTYLPAFQETSITNQILSPTLKIDKSSYYIGEPIIATGSSMPNGNITLFTEAPLRSYSATASAAGVWSITITNTDQYVLGDYLVRALVQDGFGSTSLNSPSVGFSLRNSGGVIGTPCGDIEKGDLNCDVLIDLTDFSILMYYWGTNSAVADINIDQYVNLTDFSIMMYWWGT